MFGKRITLFRLLGFEVRVDLSWLVLAAFITWTLAVGLFPYLYRDQAVRRVMQLAYEHLGGGGCFIC